MEISKYTKAELVEISSILKRFRILKKNIWNKSSETLKTEISWIKKIKIEYFPELWIDKARDLASKIYKDSYSENIREDAVWIENSLLKWWIRIFRWDDMIDITYENISHKFKNI